MVEPRVARGQLEQQREKLPGLEPQQQQPGQPQQQQRLPSGSSRARNRALRPLTEPKAAPVPNGIRANSNHVKYLVAFCRRVFDLQRAG